MRVLHTGSVDIYPMFTEPTITWVPSGFSGYIWLDTKIVLKKKNEKKKYEQWDPMLNSVITKFML